MYIVTNEEMRAIDQSTIEQWEIPSQVLMESAGLAVVERLSQDEEELLTKRVTVLVGAGNNGGDGLVIARHLYMRGVAVTVFLLKDGGASSSQDHIANRKIIGHMPVRLFEITKSHQLKLLKATLNHTDLLVDCVFGTGLNRNLNDLYIEVFDMINEVGLPCIAVDIPSGINGDTGEVMGAAIKASKTYALALPKKGCYLKNADRYTGDLVVLPIGIPGEVIAQSKPSLELLTEEKLKGFFQERPSNAHKNSFGHLGVLAGSLGMGGACVLASKAAMRVGVGVLTAFTDKNSFTPIATMLPEAMVRPVVWPNEQVLDWIGEKTSAILIGPGLGVSDEKKEILAYLLAHYKGVLVIDADALTMLAQMDKEVFHTTEAQLVLTPHPGEMGRLIGKTAAEVQEDRIQIALDYAKKMACTLVLKGHHTVIANQQGLALVNNCDSVSLATAGSGDVLAGTIASLAAQGFQAYQAAQAGVLLHGLAGIKSAEKNGIRSTMANDLIDCLGEILKDLETQKKGVC